jgi:hypothetical protein
VVGVVVQSALFTQTNEVSMTIAPTTWATANAIAHKLKTRFAPYCITIETAGELRRREENVSVITFVAVSIEDVVTVPASSLFVAQQEEPVQRLAEYIKQLLAEGVIQPTTPEVFGPTHTKFVLKTTKGADYQVEVYFTTLDNFGATLFAQTGDYRYITRLVSPQHNGGGMPDGYSFSKGQFFKSGRPLRLAHEIDVFNLYGVPFAPPEYRRGVAPDIPIANVMPEYALTVKQPWATPIVYGLKTVENRDWPPPSWLIGKPIAIHAGKTLDEGNADVVYWRTGLQAETLPTGAVLGTVVVLGYVRASAGKIVERVGDSPFVQGYQPCNWFVGEYGWILGSPQRFAKPIPKQGKQKIWKTQN